MWRRYFILLTLLAPAGAKADAALNARIDALVADVESRVADVPTLQVDALRLALASPAPPILLDVRSAKERAVSTLPGARTDLVGVPAGSQVVVYCTIGLRSGISARQLRQQGVDAVNLRGGILAWLAAGGSVVDAQGAPTQRVHVYAGGWDVVPAGMEAVW